MLTRVEWTGCISPQFLDSNIMLLPDSAQFVFMGMILLADPETGIVNMGSTALSWRLRRPVETVREAVRLLEQDDPDSRSPLENGARIKRVRANDSGWRIVNYMKYRRLVIWEGGATFPAEVEITLPTNRFKVIADRALSESLVDAGVTVNQRFDSETSVISALERHPLVYFFQKEAGVIKVGMTRNLRRRIGGLRLNPASQLRGVLVSKYCEDIEFECLNLIQHKMGLSPVQGEETFLLTDKDLGIAVFTLASRQEEPCTLGSLLAQGRRMVGA